MAEARKGQQARTARTAEATAIGENGITVKGGTISAQYPSGRGAAVFGPLTYEDTGLPGGHGLLVQADDDDAGRDIFRAKYENGRRLVFVGQNPSGDGSGATDVFESHSDKISLNTHGEELRIQANRGGPIRIYGGGTGTGASSVTIATFEGGLLKLQTVDNGDLQIVSDDRLWLYADGDLDGTVNGNITFLADGTAAFGGDGGTFLKPQSGSGTANVRMDTTTGQITWVASTERVKTAIEDLVVDPSVVLQLRPRTWLPGPVPRQCPEWAHAQHGESECHAGEMLDPPEDAPREVGFVAEELDALGLTEFVEYDAEGLPISIRYDRISAALIPVVQQQAQQITALQDALAALTERVTALEPTAPVEEAP
jgi:hypothetical protein